MPALHLESVTFAYRETRIFEGFDLVVQEGEMTAVLGPNGTGKTTLLRLAAGTLRPSSGAIWLFGAQITGMPPRERARIVAVVPQESHLLFDFTVREVVLMGRSPHLGLLGLETARDREIVEATMVRTEVEHMAKRPFRTLSGGERQRVVIARALAQEPRLLLLDEPTAFLDLKHQLAVYELIARLNREGGLSLVMASHDINLAARHCSRLVLLLEGKIVVDGAPEKVLRSDNLRMVYGVDVDVRQDPATGLPYVV